MAVLNYCLSALLCNPNQTRLLQFMSKVYSLLNPVSVSVIICMMYMVVSIGM